MSDVPLPVSVAAWTLYLAVLLPAPYRLIRRRGQWLDALLSLMALFVLNRLSFLLRVSALWGHVTAVALALIAAWMVTSYQREDRRRNDAKSVA